MASEQAISLFDPATLVEPYPVYKQLRDGPAVHFAPELNVHVVTRYDVIRDMLRDTETFSSEYAEFFEQMAAMAVNAAAPEVQAEMARIMGEMIEVPPTMLTLDEPGHTHYRSLVSQLFTAGRIKAAEESVQDVIDTAIGGMGSRTDIEFLEEFAFPVPLTIIGQRLGIPEEDVPFFNKAATAAASALRLTPLSGEQLIERAQTALDLQKLLVRLMNERRSDPRDDMLSVLATSKLESEDRPLSDGEALSILNQFLVAGHETTTSTFAWGMLILCENPQLQEDLYGDPALIRTFVEEALRLEAPVQGLPRLVKKDVEIEGYKLKPGDIMFLRYGSGNRDERKFEAPDQCDLHRKKAGSHMAFGFGVHACPGAPLSRQELTLGFRSLINLGRNFRLQSGKPRPSAEASFILRNLPELHISFDRR
jgi:cytochrome P450